MALPTRGTPPGPDIRLLMICLLAFTLVLTTIQCVTKKKTEADEIRAEGQRPETTTEVNLPGQEIRPDDKLQIPDSPEGKQLLRHFDIAYSLGADAESKYQESLAQLRQNAKTNVDILVTAYEKAEVIAYADRWIVLQTLTDMVVPEAAEPLIRFARAPLPARDTGQYDDAISPYNEESVLRITALDGLARLGTTHDPALRALQGFFRHEDPTIRLEAMNRFADAIRTVKDPQRQEELVKLFPTDYAFELRPVVYQTPGIEDPNLQPSGQGKGEPPRID